VIHSQLGRVPSEEQPKKGSEKHGGETRNARKAGLSFWDKVAVTSNRYGIAWSTKSGSVSALHLIVRHSMEHYEWVSISAPSHSEA